MATTNSFNIRNFSREVIKAKLSDFGFTVQTAKGSTLDASLPDGTTFTVQIWGRSRKGGEKKSQEGEAFKNSSKSIDKHLRDNSINKVLGGAVAVNEVSKKVVVIIAPLADLLKVNGFLKPDGTRNDIFYIRMNDEYLTRYRRIHSTIPHIPHVVVEQLDTWQDLCRQCGGENLLPQLMEEGSSPPLKTQEANDFHKRQKEDESGDNKASKQLVTSGAGFGNPEENKKVEEAAIAVVKEKYDLAGWKVRSVERDKCGFDLECHKGETTENVEVKGVSGTERSFFITAGEVEQAKINSKFVLIVVTSALSSSPVMTRYSGTEFFRRFELKVVQYRAVFRQ